MTITTRTMWLAPIAIAIACAPPGRSAEPGVLVVGENEQTAAFVRNFNPLLEAGNVRWPTRRAMYEPLLVWNPMAGAYTPWLATGYQWSADARTLRLPVRDGVRWSDGEALTADDVVFTFQLLRRHPALDTRGVWRNVRDVRADGAVVVVDFARAKVPALVDIAHQPIVPAHVWRDVDDPVRFANPDPVATGPFTEVESWRPQAYQIGRNPHAWRAPGPGVRALRFLAFPGNDAATLALVRGEIDWAGDFVPAIDRIFVARDRDHHRYWFPPIGGTVMLYPNTTRAPFDAAGVRKAISMAIDREAIVRIAMFGYTRSADATGLSDLHAGFRDAEVAASADWCTYDPRAAEALLDAAGLVRDDDGNRFEVTVLVPAGFSDWVRAANLIARDLRAVGIDARFRSFDYNTWFTRLQQGDFALALGWTEPTPAPYGFYRNLMSSHTRRPLGDNAAANWHRFASAEADAEFARLESTTDAGDIARSSRRLQELFARDAPSIPLFPGPSWAAYNTRRFVGFPSAEHPYAPPSPHGVPQALLVLKELRAR